MTRQDYLNALTELGFDGLVVKDLDTRGVTKRSLKEIVENANKTRTPNQSNNDALDKTNKIWHQRTHYFSSLAHLILLIHSPRLYVYQNAPCSHSNYHLEDAIDDMKIQIDGAMNGYEAYCNLDKVDTSNEIFSDDFEGYLKSFNDRDIYFQLCHTASTFAYIRIDTPLVYKKLEVATEILKSNWINGMECSDNINFITDFRDKVAEDRDTFYLNIDEWD